MGDKPQAAVGELHWGLLHDCVNDARTRTLKALGAIAAVDNNKRLSPVGKADKKREIAAAAVASFEKSNALQKARESVEAQLKKWNDQLGVAPKKPADVATAMQHAEIRSLISAQKPGDRMAFITSNIDDCSAAILTAPPMLSGLTQAELNVVRHLLRREPTRRLARQKPTRPKPSRTLSRGSGMRFELSASVLD